MLDSSVDKVIGESTESLEIISPNSFEGNVIAPLISIEALMERVFDVKVPEEIEQKFRELAGELAPDPINADRLRLNRLLHQTPDLPDKN